MSSLDLPATRKSKSNLIGGRGLRHDQPLLPGGEEVSAECSVFVFTVVESIS